MLSTAALFMLMHYSCIWARAQNEDNTPMSLNNTLTVQSTNVYDLKSPLQYASRAHTGVSRTKCKPRCHCGQSKTEHIVGGTQLHGNKYPWLALLILENSKSFMCGGSLISDRYVLTAAHCVYSIIPSNKTLFAQLLKNDRLSNDTGLVRKVVQIVVHPQYVRKSKNYDVALLKLKSYLDITKRVRPVCLPYHNQNFDGKMAVAAGWGKSDRVGSRYLQEVSVPIITNQQCRKISYGNRITNEMLCAGYVGLGGKDACIGDSGCPLVVKDGSYVLAGIVSWGLGCGRPLNPGVYARVTKFLYWIISNTQDSCYCLNL